MTFIKILGNVYDAEQISAAYIRKTTKYANTDGTEYVHELHIVVAGADISIAASTFEQCSKARDKIISIITINATEIDI